MGAPRSCLTIDVRRAAPTSVHPTFSVVASCPIRRRSEAAESAIMTPHQDSPDKSRTDVNICAFSALLQEGRAVWKDAVTLVSWRNSLKALDPKRPIREAGISSVNQIDCSSPPCWRPCLLSKTLPSRPMFLENRPKTGGRQGVCRRVKLGAEFIREFVLDRILVRSRDRVFKIVSYSRFEVAKFLREAFVRKPIGSNRTGYRRKVVCPPLIEPTHPKLARRTDCN